MCMVIARRMGYLVDVNHPVGNPSLLQLEGGLHLLIGDEELHLGVGDLRRLLIDTCLQVPLEGDLLPPPAGGGARL